MNIHCRRGSATLLATIFLLIMAALAAGINGTVQSAIQVSRNEQAVQQAQAAAESGVEVMKSYLTEARLAGSTADDDVVDALYDQLAALTPTNGSAPIGAVTGTGDKVTSILFPQQSDTSKPTWIKLHPAPNLSAFKAVVLADPVVAGNLLLEVTGTDGRTRMDDNSLVTRTVTVSFDRIKSTGTGSGGNDTVPPMFGFGVYSLGGIVGSGGSQGGVQGPPEIARIGSSLPTGNSIALSGSFPVSGKVYVAGNRDQVTYGDNNINGQPRPYWPSSAVEKWELDNFAVETAPAPPTFDPTVFRPYAGSVYTPPTKNAGGTHANFRIPANAGGFDKKGKPLPLTISGNGTLKLEGIVYIESPNVIDFGGGPNTFNCVFVMEKNPDVEKYPNVAATDKLTFSGNNAFGPIDSSNSSYTAVRNATTGYSILAPTANVSLTASSNATSKCVGSIIGYTVTMSGSSVFNIEDGTVISYSKAIPSCSLSGSSGIHFTRTPNYKPPFIGISNGNGSSGGSGDSGVNAQWFVYSPSTSYQEGTTP